MVFTGQLIQHVIAKAGIAGRVIQTGTDPACGDVTAGEQTGLR